MRTLLLLLLAARLDAATEYRLLSEHTGDPLVQPRSEVTVLVQPRSEVTVLVDGANWCERAGGVTQRLSNDSGKTVIALDHQLRTWLLVKSSDQPTDETFAGFSTHEYTIQARYTKHSITMGFWTSDAVPAAPKVEMITATVRQIRTVTPPPHAFERPPHYINQEPVVAAPGVIQ
jgi:hypothetical protein